MSRHDEFSRAVRATLAKARVANIEEAQALVDRLQETWNDAPLADFDGLSPRQMTAFLYHPFDAQELVTSATTPPTGVRAPILELYGHLANAIGEQGLKATAKGNLPRNLVREAAFAYYRRTLPSSATCSGKKISPPCTAFAGWRRWPGSSASAKAHST